MHAKCLGEALSSRNLNEVCFQEEESASRESPGWRVEVVEDDQPGGSRLASGAQVRYHFWRLCGKTRHNWAGTTTDVLVRSLLVTIQKHMPRRV